MARVPLVVILAGPNGAGKSTSAARLLQGALAVDEFVVAERVRRGGHSVPEDVIRRRCVAGLRNFFHRYRDLVDSWQFYDNGTLEGPRLLASGSVGRDTEVLVHAAWAGSEQM
jgi:predicted ABC-type ATPase